jgi:phosphinothricin acetyltransferase
MNASEIAIEPMAGADWPEVAAIYREGIATGEATFAGFPPETFADFIEDALLACALVAREGAQGRMLGWAKLSPVSDRCVYAGVAEVSLYVAESVRGRGVGGCLLHELIVRSERAGIWTLQAGIFPENAASLALHARHGFRTVGRRERIGRMTHGPRAGTWRDTVLLERRSAVAGRD